MITALACEMSLNLSRNPLRITGWRDLSDIKCVFNCSLNLSIGTFYPPQYSVGYVRDKRVCPHAQHLLLLHDFNQKLGRAEEFQNIVSDTKFCIRAIRQFSNSWAER